ncbi:MAG: hypothetical protein H6810_01675 [Phycisphaeraceae bacterium]|nr:MAG: hypothetical protein H6810_01675 [Phycisphaeraceae bacterium]
MHRSAIVCLAIVTAANAQTIDFETQPDGSTPVDNQQLPLDAPYAVGFNGGTLHVLLGFDVDGDGVVETPAVFEATGSDPITAFDAFGADGPAPAFAEQLGQWFLRSESALNNSAPVGILVAQYDQPVPGCAGEIWDIDGPEQWEIRGYRAGETDPVVTVLSPAGGFNGEPWVFTLADPTVGFSRLEIEHIGTRPNNQLGLAFNNFIASETVPGPTILTTQPLGEIRNAEGTETVTVYWSVPVTLTEDDVTVVTDDGLDLPVSIDVTGSGTQATTIIFRGPPGGSGGGPNDPLLNNAYRITIGGVARDASNNVLIDGDNDGIAGGDAVFTIAHRCLADMAQPAGIFDLADVLMFVESFNSNCE